MPTPNQRMRRTRTLAQRALPSTPSKKQAGGELIESPEKQAQASSLRCCFDVSFVRLILVVFLMVFLTCLNDFLMVLSEGLLSIDVLYHFVVSCFWDRSWGINQGAAAILLVFQFVWPQQSCIFPIPYQSSLITRLW